MEGSQLEKHPDFYSDYKLRGSLIQDAEDNEYQSFAADLKLSKKRDTLLGDTSEDFD